LSSNVPSQRFRSVPSRDVAVVTTLVINLAFAIAATDELFG
jgi:hypothetical protein